MPDKLRVLIIIGSASTGSSNQRLAERFTELTQDSLEFSWAPDLRTLPAFDPALSTSAPPAIIGKLRQSIEQCDAVLISTPEYIFSIPSGLKNLMEWCVASTVFTDKPVGIITASAHGVKAHEELQMIIRTLGARLSEKALMLVQGIKGKIGQDGVITDPATGRSLEHFAAGFIEHARSGAADLS